MGLTLCKTMSMSFATDMLTAAQTAYQNALSGKLKQLDGRRLEQHDIAVLRKEVEHWQAKADAEAARANGQPARKPFQVVL